LLFVVFIVDGTRYKRALAGVEQMNDDDRSTIKKLIDAFITKKKVQHLVQ
jgi:hypothetical protein